MKKAIALLSILAAIGYNSSALADPSNCEKRVNKTFKSLLECVGVEGVRRHQAQFQTFADDADGNRASGFDGYDMSADYIAGLMEAAGYEVTI